MRILVVTATSLEVAPLLTRLNERHPPGAKKGSGVFSAETVEEETPDPFFCRDGWARVETCSRAGHDVDVLVTGVGMVATAAWTSRVLTETPYDLALNVGVCGSFDRALPPGSVVHVVSDCMAELGAEDGDSFLTVQELGLLAADEFPFTAGRLVNRKPPENSALGALPPVHGVTVNSVHGNERSIAAVAQRFKPQVESMEGAGFVYACAIREVVYAQVRAVSNVVEKRNREGWKMTDAIARLSDTALNIVDRL